MDLQLCGPGGRFPGGPFGGMGGFCGMGMNPGLGGIGTTPLYSPLFHPHLNIALTIYPARGPGAFLNQPGLGAYPGLNSLDPLAGLLGSLPLRNSLSNLGGLNLNGLGGLNLNALNLDGLNRPQTGISTDALTLALILQQLQGGGGGAGGGRRRRARRHECDLDDLFDFDFDDWFDDEDDVEDPLLLMQRRDWRRARRGRGRGRGWRY
jgi:hypothetical protein